MWKRILIANRGEIALRIIRCCREMGIETVVVYSKEDEDTLPVLMAGKSICIGKAKASETYLNQDVLIDCAKKTFCQAIHPGYGFLSENPEFAEACVKSGITFIGPTADMMRAMGDKISSKKIAMDAQVPTIPGIDHAVSGYGEVEKAAEFIGYPIMLKASNGGGGRGMRIVNSQEELEKAYREAREESRKAFGDEQIFVEKYLRSPKGRCPKDVNRHIYKY